MRTFTVVLLVLLAATAFADAPSARDVVVRGGSSLTDLLERATRDAWAPAERPRPVLIVVDVTPNTANRRTGLEPALIGLADSVRRLDGSWRIAPLGGAPGEEWRHPSGLLGELSAALRETRRQRSTLAALSRTISRWPESDGLVVYLADWNFEDDDGLEGFISRLKAKGRTLTVIGSEAAFTHGWNHGFFPLLNRGGRKAYEDGIGRAPFGPEIPGAPWHGGDTAWPHLPFSFLRFGWQTTFGLDPSSLQDTPEDLTDRLSREKAPPAKVDIGMQYPLSSSWGPYGLMRAAGETGGRYFLLSYNPRGRTDVVYDYSRCNQYPPDLRSRSRILAEMGRRPFAAALVKAWNLVANRRIAVADITAPLDEVGRGRREMEYTVGTEVPDWCWTCRTDYQRFFRNAERHMEALDSAIGLLGRTLAARAADDVDARYRADAALFHHTLLVIRFQLRERMLAAGGIPRDAWDLDNRRWHVGARDFILPGGLEKGEVPALDAAAGEALLAARRAFLERYGGTPFGEIVRKNRVLTYRLDTSVLQMEEDVSSSRTPSESQTDAPPTRKGPGAGSKGSGSSSGSGK